MRFQHRWTLELHAHRAASDVTDCRDDLPGAANAPLARRLPTYRMVKIIDTSGLTEDLLTRISAIIVKLDRGTALSPAANFGSRKWVLSLGYVRALQQKTSMRQRSRPVLCSALPAFSCGCSLQPMASISALDFSDRKTHANLVAISASCVTVGGLLLSTAASN